MVLRTDSRRCGRTTQEEPRTWSLADTPEGDPDGQQRIGGGKKRSIPKNNPKLLCLKDYKRVYSYCTDLTPVC